MNILCDMYFADAWVKDAVLVYEVIPYVNFLPDMLIKLLLCFFKYMHSGTTL